MDLKQLHPKGCCRRSPILAAIGSEVIKWETAGEGGIVAALPLKFHSLRVA